MNNPWVLDIEIFNNLFTVVAKKLGEKEYVKFVVHESQNDMPAFMDWLGQRPTIIGYNVIDFDGQLIEFIWQKGGHVTVEEIYEFTQKLINRPEEDKFNLPYSEWELSFKYIDLFKINHYDNKKVSLKWLEFSIRWSKLADIPIAHNLSVPRSKIVDVLRYNTNDVDITEAFYFKCEAAVHLRKELADKYHEARLLNMSDSSIGSFIFESLLIKEYGYKKADLKKGSHYDTINVKDCLVDYISFQAPELQEVYDNFQAMQITDVKTKGIKGAEYQQLCMFEDMVFVYGSGGVHACYKAGEYVSDNENIILSVDVASYYPNLSISNSFYPKHIGQSFCKIYKQVFDERRTYPKGSALNYAYKIALNSVYGKSNSKFSLFYDPAYTLKITVNGQLLLTMLAEGLSSLGRLLMVNTDGIEIMIPRSKEAELKAICAEWEALTSLELEYNSYDKLVIRDVNNYMAVDVKGKAKRKGVFEIYYDYTEEDGKPHQYHKKPDATIIPNALFNYYAKGESIEETITRCNDIHEFCYAIKKQRGFEHWLITADKRGVIDIDKRHERVLRYYISKEGANIFKHWLDGRNNDVVGVNRGQLVKLAMKITNPEIEFVKKATKTKESELILQYDVDKEHYVNECYKLIDIIKEGTRDAAYIAYQKGVKLVEESTEDFD